MSAVLDKPALRSSTCNRTVFAPRLGRRRPTEMAELLATVSDSSANVAGNDKISNQVAEPLD